MRKLVVLSFITLDGVMQAPGGPEEDSSDGFKYGGWSFPYFDDFLGQEMSAQLGNEADLLLGRKTYDIFAAYWPNVNNEKEPFADVLNNARKYVVSDTLHNPTWNNSIVINGNVPHEISKLKEEAGPMIQVHGSGNLIQTLLKYDLVDELWLKIFPVVLGSGKRLFENESFAGEFEVIGMKISPTGVIIADYKRSGAVRTGSFG